MICQDFEQLFYPILNAVRISQDFEQLSSEVVQKWKSGNIINSNLAEKLGEIEGDTINSEI